MERLDKAYASGRFAAIYEAEGTLAFEDFVSINGIMMMTSTTVSYAYDFVDGMRGTNAPEGGNSKGERSSLEGSNSRQCGHDNSACGGCGGGGRGGVMCMLTYFGMGEVKLGRSAAEHLFAAKVNP